MPAFPLTSERAARLGWLAGLLPGNAAFAVERCHSDAAGLLPEELPLVAGASTKRRREFAAGRRAARRALAGLGREAATILAGEAGEPRWPLGVTGSISHCDTWAIAVVAQGDDFLGIGVDIEDEGPLEATLWPLITTPAELAVITRLTRSSATEAGLRAHETFVAKECAYKCQYPLTGMFLEFADVEVAFEPARDGVTAFRATLLHAGLPERYQGMEIQGRIMNAGGCLIGAAGIPR
jgi:4'-phosphopantetheinyl transferase EntD